jgi:ABC-type dipeptide/oligopeptide/nickel transport system permease component
VVGRALEQRYPESTGFTIEVVEDSAGTNDEKQRGFRVNGYHGLTGGFRVSFVASGEVSSELSWRVERASMAPGCAWAFGVLVGCTVMLIMWTTLPTAGFVDIITGGLCTLPGFLVGLVLIYVFAPLLRLGGGRVSNEQLHAILATVNASLAAGEPVNP